MANEGNQTESDTRIEETIETEDKDMFDDVFGEDKEKNESRKKLAEKATELKKQKEKKLEGTVGEKKEEADEDEDRKSTRLNSSH